MGEIEEKIKLSIFLSIKNEQKITGCVFTSWYGSTVRVPNDDDTGCHASQPAASEARGRSVGQRWLAAAAACWAACTCTCTVHPCAVDRRLAELHKPYVRQTQCAVRTRICSMVALERVRSTRLLLQVVRSDLFTVS
jgi:hypothetical protein